MSDAPETSPADLPAIEFSSPGCFAVRNPASAALPAERWEPAPFRLGEHEPLERFEHPQEARAHALALLQQARRSLCLHSPDLESWLYHHSSIRKPAPVFSWPIHAIACVSSLATAPRPCATATA